MFINALFCTKGSLSFSKLMRPTVSLSCLAFVTSLCWSLEHTSTGSEDDTVLIDSSLASVESVVTVSIVSVSFVSSSHVSAWTASFLGLGHTIHQPAKLYSRQYVATNCSRYSLTGHHVSYCVCFQNTQFLVVLEDLSWPLSGQETHLHMESLEAKNCLIKFCTIWLWLYNNL